MDESQAPLETFGQSRTRRAANAGADRLRPTPLYEQVRGEILNRLITGFWKPGEALPSEFDLAKTFGVSQGTVRRALNEMAGRNLVTRVQGRGTFVREYDSRWALFHFFHIVAADGTRLDPETELLHHEVRPAPGRVAERLGLEPDEPVTWMERVRYLGGEPAIYETVAAPTRFFPGLGVDNAIPNSIYTLYEQVYGILISNADEELSAAAADETMARHLKVDPGTPLLAIERVALSLDGRKVEWRISYCETEGRRYRIHLGA